jgi:hypothetical protein
MSPRDFTEFIKDKILLYILKAIASALPKDSYSIGAEGKKGNSREYKANEKTDTVKTGSAVSG